MVFTTASFSLARTPLSLSLSLTHTVNSFKFTHFITACLFHTNAPLSLSLSLSLTINSLEFTVLIKTLALSASKHALDIRVLRRQTCILLQCVAVRAISVLQCAAVCCRVLQCVAVRVISVL